LVLLADSREVHSAVVSGSLRRVGREPAWVRTLPVGGVGEVFAVGVSPVTFREESGWQAAERHARLLLAASGATTVRGMERGFGPFGSAVLHLRATAVLSEVHVEARWRDGRSCFVLVRGKVQSSN